MNVSRQSGLLLVLAALLLIPAGIFMDIAINPLTSIFVSHWSEITVKEVSGGSSNRTVTYECQTNTEYEVEAKDSWKCSPADNRCKVQLWYPADKDCSPDQVTHNNKPTLAAPSAVIIAVGAFAVAGLLVFYALYNRSPDPEVPRTPNPNPAAHNS